LLLDGGLIFNFGFHSKQFSELPKRLPIPIR
jgi:hypothetical protein